jgi:excisionase family DNA binding protein
MNERRDSFPTMSNSTPPHLISARVAARLSGEVMNLKELCAFLGFSRSKVKRLIKDGTIPGKKYAGMKSAQWRFSREEILAIWDRNK